MALPSSGLISLNQVNVELKNTDTAVISLGDAAVMMLAKVTSGPISMSDLHGKSSEVRFVNETNHTQASIFVLMGSPTEAGTYIFENTATISAASKGGWALQTGAFPVGSTLTIINRGAIRGGGGNGGNQNAAGGAGGTALVLNFPVVIDNTGGTIWGGGGGGGGAAYFAAGGGGGGMPAGSGGKGEGNLGGNRNSNGKGGSATGGGGGGRWDFQYGGAGGAPGAAGVKGRTDGGSGGKSGGRGGYSVQMNGNEVTWIDEGGRKGSVV